MLKFSLTDSVSVPMETKIPNKLLLRIVKVRNKKTQQIEYRLKQVQQVDYEFECEALADYQYRTAPFNLLASTFELDQMKPTQFATGTSMYAQVRDFNKLTQQSFPTQSEPLN